MLLLGVRLSELPRLAVSVNSAGTEVSSAFSTRTRIVLVLFIQCLVNFFGVAQFSRNTGSCDSARDCLSCYEQGSPPWGSRSFLEEIVPLGGLGLGMAGPGSSSLTAVECKHPLEVWPESHWPGFKLPKAGVLQSCTTR